MKVLSYIRILTIGLLLWGTACNCAEKPDWRQQAIQTLNAALSKGTFWEQIHAAEAMLDLRLKRECIINIFSQRLQNCKRGEPMETGILRVLIQGTDDKNEYLSRLRAIAFNSNAAGQIHAIEALAKLGYHSNAKEVAKLKKLMTSPNKLLAAYSIWLLSCTGEKSSGKKLEQMLSNSDDLFYITAANAMYFRDSLSPDAVHKLNEIFKNDKQPFLFRSFVFRALAKHKKITISQVKLFWQANRKNVSGKSLRMVLQALGECDFRAIAAEIVPYLTNSNCEIRIAAAYAVLKNLHP